MVMMIDDDNDNDINNNNTNDDDDDYLKYVAHPARTHTKPANSQSLERILNKINCTDNLLQMKRQKCLKSDSKVHYLYQFCIIFKDLLKIAKQLWSQCIIE